MLRALSLCVLCLGSVLVAQDDVLQKAREAQKAGLHDRALELVEGAWATLKDNPAAVEIAADASIRVGRFDAGMDYGLRLTKLAPDNPKGFQFAGQGFYWTAQERSTEEGADKTAITALFEEAAGSLAKYIAKVPDDIEMLKLSGHANFFAERQPAAIEAFNAALKLAPKDADILFFRARSERVAEMPEAAIRSLYDAVQLAPDRSYLHMGLADAYGAYNRLADAAKTYGAALKCATLSDEDAARASLSIWQILGAREKKYDEGLALIEGWLEKHPKAVFGWWWRGFWLTQKGDLEGAIAAYEKSFTHSGGKQADAAANIGDLMARMATPTGADGRPDPTRMDIKKLEEAARWYMKAHAVADWNWGEITPAAKASGLFNYMASNNRLAEGAKLLETIVVPAAPNDWMALNNLGLYYRDLGGAKRDKALCDKSRHYYDRAAVAIRASETATAQQKAGVFNDAGVLYHFPNYLARDMDKGLAYYREALAADPNWVDANENMGLCMNELGRFEDAKPYFKRVLEQDPNRRVSVRGLAEAERRSGGQ